MSQAMYGLVLVGGKSERMGRDKALLSYDGEQTQLERTASLLDEVCDKVFVSLRKEQDFTLPQNTTPVFDSVESVQGPLCGILSAMSLEPEADWLVVACDFPYLSAAILQKLIDGYREESPPQLTAYRSTYDGLPEPLCAIYPSGQTSELIELSKALRTVSPRKLLVTKGARLIRLSDPHRLDNINTADEYEAAIKSS